MVNDFWDGVKHKGWLRQVRQVTSFGEAVGLNALARNKSQASGGDAEFKALIDRYYSAWTSMNTDNAAPLYAREKRAGKWLIVHEHVSASPGMIGLPLLQLKMGRIQIILYAPLKNCKETQTNKRTSWVPEN